MIHHMTAVLILLGACVASTHADQLLLRLETNTNDWRMSSVVHSGYVSGESWLGVDGDSPIIPPQGTFTIEPSSGSGLVPLSLQVAADALGLEPLLAPEGISFFAVFFDLPHAVPESIRMELTAVGDAEMAFYQNGGFVMSTDVARFHDSLIDQPYPTITLIESTEDIEGLLGSHHWRFSILGWNNQRWNLGGENAIIIGVGNPAGEGPNAGGLAVAVEIYGTPIPLPGTCAAGLALLAGWGMARKRLGDRAVK